MEAEGRMTVRCEATAWAINKGEIVLDTRDGEVKIPCDRVIARMGSAPPRAFVEFQAQAILPIAAEIRTPSNVLARVSVGATYRLAESFTDLCMDPLPPSGEPRCPPGALDAQIAREGRDLFVRVGLGYSW